MVKKRSKKTTCKKSFYLSVLNELKTSTNLGNIKEKFGISKQNLNYYLKQLKQKGFIINKADGWYELTEKGKNPTKYGIFLKADSVRGHAYIWEVEIEKIPDKWKDRIEILENKGINFKRVGALKNTPRIKVLGRKVWLCNDHIRIFDTEKSSYYGETAKESRINSKVQALKIINSLNNKLGLNLNQDKIKFKKEHYALIKNDLAKYNNQKGVVMRIKDEEGKEWLLIDDSLEQGGELENIGKKAYKTNPKMQKWWNDNKKTNFDVTSTFVLNGLNTLTKNQERQHQDIMLFAEQLNRHIPAYEGMAKNTAMLVEEIKNLKEEIKNLKK